VLWALNTRQEMDRRHGPTSYPAEYQEKGARALTRALSRGGNAWLMKFWVLYTLW
jgi:hypothetical protein